MFNPNIQDTHLWGKVKNRICDTWAQVNEEELEKTHGNLSKVAELIEKHYGEDRQLVLDKLYMVVSDSTLGLVKESGNFFKEF